MQTQSLIYLFVGLSFALYIGIALWSRAGSTKDFYVAGGGVNPVVNGMATAADWMSAASFLSMAGLIAFLGYDGSVYLMGWTGGFVLLALLLAPYLRKFGQFTVPDFIGTRYYSKTARTVAVLCLIFISFTYIAGQMRGVGIVFSRFLDVEVETGVVIGMAIVFVYSVFGGMKGVTYTQVAQFCVLIFAYLVPAIYISILVTGNPVPQLGLGSTVADGSHTYVLERLDQSLQDMGFSPYTASSKSQLDIFCITAALMFGTAGLPHVIVRFFTVRKSSEARISAGWALAFIALLYTTAPAVAAFARLNFNESIDQTAYLDAPGWFTNWEANNLIAWRDKNADGKMQIAPGDAFVGPPTFSDGVKGASGERLMSNPEDPGANEVYLDRDIIVLANPEIARLPGWVIALVAAGGLAAALSTAAGLLLVISSAISHDLLKQTFRPDISEKTELRWARGAATAAILVAGVLGIYPPGWVGQVVAFAFGLAAASLFPAIFLGIFTKSMNREGAIAGMVAGLLFTFCYIAYFRLIAPDASDATAWLFGISPEGIGFVGMLLNFAVALIVARLTTPPPQEVGELVEAIRVPRGAGAAVAH